MKAAYLFITLCIWATLPFGSVAPWARAVVTAGCLVSGCAGFASAGRAGPSGTRRGPGTGGLRIVLWLLAGWALFQLVPLPVRVLSSLQPGARDLYGALFRAGDATPICGDRFPGLNALCYWLAVGFFTAACSRVFDSRRRQHVLLTALAVGGTFQAMFGMLQHGTEWLGNSFSGPRFTGSFTSGNSFGGYLLLTLPATLGMLLASVSDYAREQSEDIGAARLLFGMGRRYPVRFLWLVVAAVLQGAALILSGSRGAITACILCVILLTAWFIAEERRRSISSHALGLLGACIGLLAILGLGGGYAMTIGRFQDMADQAGAISIGARLEIWKAAAKLFVQRPLGVGLDCCGQVLIGDHPPFPGRRAYLVHNDYLQSLCELGLPGFILLVVAGLLMARRIARRVRATGIGGSAWFRRAAALSVLGGLLHAFVDFNLSSRPGVAVTFFALLGMALSCPAADKDEAGAGAGASPPRESTVRPGRAVAFLGVVLVGLVGLRFGVVSWLMEVPETAAGENADEYFWLGRPSVGRGADERYLRWATMLAPDNARCHYVAGMCRVAAFRRNRELALNSATAGTPRSAGDELKQLAGSIRLAMREEETAAYGEAAPAFRRALLLSPWHPDYRVVMGRAYAEMSVAAGSEDEASRLAGEAVAEVRRAVLLAPMDRPVLVRACLALAAVEEGRRGTPPAEDARRMLLEYGGMALRLAGGAPGDVLGVFDRVGLSLPAVLALPDLPPPVVWELYERHNHQDESGDALRCLAALDTACRNPAAKFVSALGSVNPENWAQLERRQVIEHARWLLRLGLWENYAALAPRRDGVFESVLTEKLGKFEGMRRVSSQVRRLTLKETMEKWGLDMPRHLELCGLEYACGDIALGSRLLAELAMGRDETNVVLRQWVGSQEGAHARRGDPGYVMALARVCFDGGEYDGAARILKDVIFREEMLLQFLGRAELMLARCLASSGEPEAAGESVLRAVRISPTDPDALNMLVRLKGASTVVRGFDGRQVPAGEALAAISPPSKIGMKFRGGLVELRGIETQAPSASLGRPGTLLRAYWRFYGTVPSDLKAVAVVQDMDRLVTLYSRGHLFREAGGVLYTAGSPPVGSVIVTEFLLPVPRESANCLQLGLQTDSGGRWLSSTENLPYLELFLGVAKNR